MSDQAERLRQRMATLASPGGAAQGGGAGGPGGPGGDASPPRLARALAIGSGKGGVGKSTLALGIAWAAAERGVRTALVDADLGLANLDILCGLQPVRTAADWLAGRAPLAECFARVAPRLWLLPGASGVARMADLAPPQRVRLHGGLARVAAHVDLMVLDLGAGLGAGTLDLAVAADRLLVVCTPEPTSLADAYGFVKACARRGRTDRVELAVNMAHSVEAARVAAARVERTCARFLGVACPCAGVVPADAAVRASVEARRPLLSHAPRSEAARSVRRLEGALLGGGDAAASEVGARLAEGFLARMARALGLASRGSSEAPTTYSEGAPRGGHHPQGVSQPMPAMAR